MERRGETTEYTEYTEKEEMVEILQPGFRVSLTLTPECCVSECSVYSVVSILEIQLEEVERYLCIHHPSSNIHHLTSIILHLSFHPHSFDWKVREAERAVLSGSYIDSTLAGGAMEVPVMVQRAR